MKRLLGALMVGAVVLVPSLLFLGRYAIEGTGIAPVGSDTPQHVWRSSVVAELGLEALPTYDGGAHALHTNADRPGLPLVTAALTAVTGASARDLAYLLPAVIAVAIAAAAAALVGSLPGVPGWGAVLTGLVTGASVQVALAANGYLDQLLVEPLVLAAGAAALTAAAGRPGRTLSAMCLVAAFLVHWQFATLFAGLLVLLALVCLPASVASRQGSLVDSASGRIATAVGAGAGLGLLALLVGAAGTPRPPTEFARGTSGDRGQAPLYRLPATVLAAGAGVASLLAPGNTPVRRRAGWLLGSWALLPAGAALLYAAGLAVPVQRTLSFALAIPLLGGLGAIAAVRWLRARAGTVAGIAAAVLVAAALLTWLSFGWDAWRSRRPWSDGRRLAEVHTLSGYLAGGSSPAVIVVDSAATDIRSTAEFGTISVLRRVRAELPAIQALRTTVYLGDPDLLAEGRPTFRPDAPGFDDLSRETWSAVRPLLDQDPVVVILRSHFVGFGEALHEHPGWSSNGWMAVVEGPPAPTAQPAPPARPTAGTLAAWWASSLLVITFAGAGWAGRFGAGSVPLRMGLAPAAGLASLVVAGLVAERLGIRMGGTGGVMVVLVVTVVGAAVAVTRPPRADDPRLRYVPEPKEGSPEEGGAEG